MKKIYIDKSDSVASVVERIIGSVDQDIVLYVPRFTKLASSNNFRLLKREINASGKNVEVESVDDEVLELAKSMGIKAVNPFFRKNRRPMSDIVSLKGESEEVRTTGRKIVRKMIVQEDSSDDGSDEGRIDEEIEEEKFEELGEAEIEGVEEYHHRDHDHHPKERVLPGILKGSRLKAIAVLAILGVLVAGAAVILPSAKIKVVLEKINWDFNGSLVASASIKDPYLSNGQVKVGGIILEKSKNLTASYPATGTESVSRKASGQITIYNAYSGSPQTLVKDTRFSSPEGKIFRIAKAVLVPGAKIIDNKIVPSGVEVTVYADKPGSEYNIEPTRFRIPGFQGSPKYDGFYAESTEPITGGFVGVTKVPTEGDIIKARDANKRALENALNAEASLSIPAEIKVINNAARFIVTKEDVNRITDESGQFKVTTFGVKKVFGFKGGDIVKAMKVELIDELNLQSKKGDTAPAVTDLDLKERSISYGEPKVDFEKKEMLVAVKFKSVWTRKFDEEKFKAAVLGLRESELSANMKSFAGIKSVSINLWPFWVMRIPKNPSKVSIDVE